MSRALVSDPPATSVPPVPGTRGSEPEPRPASGPAAAAVLAAGLGCSALGVLSVLAAAAETVSDALTLSSRVGDISGITTVAAVVFFAAWAALAAIWRGADPPLGRVALASGALVALGLLGTFPPFFTALG